MGKIMDNRFILIFFIIIACVFNLFLVAEYSDVIGTASVDVSKYTFSLPKDFILLETTDQNSILITNTKSGLDIAFSVISNDYSSNFKLNELQNDSRYSVISNGTINRDDVSIESIYYKHINSNNNKSDAAIFYFNKYDASFKVRMENFNYDLQRNETIDSLSYVVDSLRVNYKR